MSVANFTAAGKKAVRYYKIIVRYNRIYNTWKRSKALGRKDCEIGDKTGLQPEFYLNFKQNTEK